MPVLRSRSFPAIMTIPPALGCAITLSLLAFWVWRTLLTLKRGFDRLRRLHQIPCTGCSFFTGEMRLPCTVHPATAFTEGAISCRDFEAMP
ncbi:hypothetical protein [Synechococcus sp. PCC 7336]|uniref:hypothetical protein n=1 Tax=Synechococcus sp. PCC 7336 TaxID=195250 RepID=UPI00034BA4C0|nr:hypothetical protein [Synechococcus sp. PCC 7336]